MKLNEEATAYGSALFAFKKVLIGIVLWAKFDARAVSNAIAQLLFPHAKLHCVAMQ